MMTALMRPDGNDPRTNSTVYYKNIRINLQD